MYDYFESIGLQMKNQFLIFFNLLNVLLIYVFEWEIQWSFIDNDCSFATIESFNLGKAVHRSTYTKDLSFATALGRFSFCPTQIASI